MPETPEDVLAFYALGQEDKRLFEDARGLLERTRTEELLSRFLPPAPAVVLDVGGGPGHYALWLAAHGYEVHLVDPVPLHIEQAQGRSARAAQPLASIERGDARQLTFADATADAVLLLGPLYHLDERVDRLAALEETRRVLRPGGVVFVAAICRFASALDGLARHLFDDPVFGRLVAREFADGLHRDGKADAERGERTYFTSAYLHRPEELAAELTDAGLRHAATLALEGPAWLLQDLDEQWRTDQRREAILQFARATEAEPSIIGASSHLMAIGHRDHA